MSVSVSPELERKLVGVNSIHGIQQVLASEGMPMSDLEVARGLIAEGSSSRFAGLSPAAQDQVAQLIVLAEADPSIAAVVADPEQVADRLPELAAAHGLKLDSEALAALSKPLDLSDTQLEQVVGGIDPLTASLITLGITTLGGVLTLWITKHYETKERIAAGGAK
jgi:hypothetical protein